MRHALTATAMVLALTATSLATAHAAIISGLYNTGVSASGSLLPDGASDPHYAVVVGGSGPASALDNGDATGLGWIGSTATSEWISAAPGGFAGGGPFTYETTFTVTGSGSVSLAGAMAADDQAKIFLNGVDVFDGALTSANPWSFLQPFTITSGFIAGINTLDFVVPNNLITSNDGPTGVQVVFTPEPASLALVGFGLAALGLARRRR